MTVLAPSDRQAAAPAAAPATFPALGSAGPRVDPAAYVEPGTGLMVTLACLVAIPLGLIAAIATWGVAVAVAVVLMIVELLYARRVMAMIKGSAVEVGPEQLPQIDACVRAYSERLGMTRPPAVYVMQAKSLNAFAMRVGSRQVVILLDEVVDACARSAHPQSLAFIIGHELAHHALGHTGRLRSHLRLVLKRLSRLDELSCDSVAMQLVREPAAAAHAIAILVAGPALLPLLNFPRLAQQAQEVAHDPLSRKAEKKLSHPLLLRRMARCLAAQST